MSDHDPFEGFLARNRPVPPPAPMQELSSLAARLNGSPPRQTGSSTRMRVVVATLTAMAAAVVLVLAQHRPTRSMRAAAELNAFVVESYTAISDDDEADDTGF